MDYFRLVFATLVGFVIFLEVPQWETMVGAVLIIATSFFTVRAEKRAGEAARKAAAAKES